LIRFLKPMPEVKKHPLYDFMSRHAGETEVRNEIQDRLVDAAKWALITTAANIAARGASRKLMSRSGQRFMANVFGGYPQRVSNPLPLFPAKGIVSDVLAGGIGGYFERDIRNALVRAKKDPSKEQEAMEKIKTIALTQHPLMIERGLQKKAFWGRAASSAGKGLATAGRAGLAGLTLGMPFGGTRVAQAVAGTKKFGPMAHVFGWGMKGLAGVEAYKGGKAIYNVIQKNRPYDRSYTRMLRNNMLAGRISPEELHPEDVSSVRKMGMR